MPAFELRWPSETHATLAEALKTRLSGSNQMSARRAVEDKPGTAGQVDHDSEFIALDAIRTPHRLKLLRLL